MQRRRPGPSALKSFMDLGDPTEQHPWQAGIWTRCPKYGLGCLLLNLVCIGVCTVIVMLGDDLVVFAPIPWGVQPTVYLVIAALLAVMSAYSALSEAVRVNWWRQAMGPDITVVDLHRSWQFHQYFWAALTAGRHANYLAVVCLVVGLAPLSLPLYLQSMRIDENPAEVKLSLAETLPDGFYTGMVGGRDLTPLVLTPHFSRILNLPLASSSRFKTSTNGLGFNVTCSPTVQSYNLEDVNGTDLFRTEIRWSNSRPSQLNVQAVHKADSACSGQLQVQSCVLETAQVAYPVLVERTSISLDYESPVKVKGPADPGPGAQEPGPSVWGGFAKAVSDAYASSVRLQDIDGIGFEVSTTGSFANQFVVAASPATNVSDHCNIAFRSPVEQLIANIHALCLRTVAAASKSQYLPPLGPQYNVSYACLAAASGWLLLGWFAIGVLYLKSGGWWQAGRSMTLSPVEIAAAFGADVCRGEDGNLGIRDLLVQCSHRPIRYGVVGSEAHVRGKDEWLGFAPAGSVRPPEPGQVYG